VRRTLLLRRRFLTSDRTLLALVRPGVRVRPLTAYRESPAVPQSAIAPDVHQALDIHGSLGAKRTLDLEVALDLATETIHIVIVEILGPPVRIHTARIENLFGAGIPDTKDVGESDLNSFSARQIYASDTCHVALPLTLFVLWIPRADDSDHAFTADHLTVLTDWLDAASDLHFASPNPFVAELESITSSDKAFNRPWARMNPHRQDLLPRSIFSVHPS
jgi:hypothetical protein